MERAKTSEGTGLWHMVDPFTYRDRLAIPKFLINGTNDRYWTLNALDLYWNELKGPKYLVELPNAGHGLEVNRDWALNGLGAFFRHSVTGRPMPALSWSMKNQPAKEWTLAVQADPAPVSARLWTATAGSRDFRESKWTSSPLQPGNTITAAITPPDTGHMAALAELEYLIDGLPYHLTTTFFEPGLEPRKRASE